MKKVILLPLVALLIVGCVKLSDNIFRTEQGAVDLAYGAYVGYTQALPQLHLSADQIAAVKSARLKFAASVAVLDGWRLAYETNSAMEPQVKAALQATLSQSSNFIWLANYMKGVK